MQERVRGVSALPEGEVPQVSSRQDLQAGNVQGEGRRNSVCQWNLSSRRVLHRAGGDLHGWRRWRLLPPGI
jgi:hypothetical protein